MPHFAVLRPYKICVQCHKLLISLRFLHNPITIVSEYVIILHLFIPTGAIRKRQELLFLAVRRTKWTEAQRAEVIHPVSHNSVTGPEIKPPAEEPPDKNPCLSHLCKWQNFTAMHLKTNGGSKKDKGQNSVPRRGEKQEAVVKTCFEDQVEGMETTR